MRRLVLISTAALALSLAVFAAWSFGSGGSQDAEAAPTPPPWMDCSISFTPPDQETVTCTGTILVITPFGHKTINFVLVVTATDNPPVGPSWGDQINGCTININNNGPRVIHVGPCP